MKRTILSVALIAGAQSGQICWAQVDSDQAEPVMNEEIAPYGDTLRDAILSAYQKNPSVLAQRRARLIADEQLVQAKSAWKPSVGVNTSTGYQQTRTNGFLGQQIPTRDNSAANASVGLEISQSIWSGGRIAAGVNQAQEGVNVAEAELFTVEQDMILNVVSAYMEVRTQLAAVEIRKSNVKVLETQVEAAKARFEAGEVTRTDVAQAQARLAGAEAQFAATLSGLESARAQYEALVGRAPIQLADVPDAPLTPEELETAVQAALSRNPELVALRASAKAAAHGVDAAKAERRPNVSLSGRAGLNQTYGDPGIEDSSASVTATFSMPIYQGGLFASQIRAAKLQEDQLKQQVRAAERLRTANVTRAWYLMVANKSAIDASQRQVEAAEIAFEGAEQELAVGLRTTLDVLDQEQELLTARLALIEAERDYYVAVHQLLAEMGQLSPQSLGVNIPL